MEDRSASEFELKTIRTPEESYDVVVLGGGLAGLCLGLQLRQTRPGTSVLVADKRAEPAPESTFKVGESTSESGAYYYRVVLGLEDHLAERQLRKRALRMFFPAGDNSDITKRVEFASPLSKNVHNFQIDRGVFENELFARCNRAGADALRGWRVKDVEIGPGDGAHRVTVESDGFSSTVSARWVIDASGRANLLRRELGLGTDIGHHINSAWFRLAGGLDIEDWTDDDEWLGRTHERGIRRHSTVHLTGEGYWIWLIQLATGPISIGLVADPRFHPFDEFNEFDRLVNWFREHEPQLGAEVDARRADVMDFLVVEDFAYGCERVMSPDRWCLTGEAAGFIDPFYSPGSDFIGYTNSFITDLVNRDLDGEDVEERLEFYNFFFYQLFDPTVSLYKDQYQFFGNPQVMISKVLYDTHSYFSTLAFLFLHGRMTQLDDLGDVVDVFQTVIPLLGRVQDLVRDWHQLEQREWQGVSALAQQFKPLVERINQLAEPFEGDALLERARQNAEVMKAVAVWIFHKAARNLPEPPDAERPIDALAVSLKPERWEEDGLFAEDGMTLAQALELLPGIEEFDLEARGALLAET